ncbi:MAG: phosphotransferase family protein [Anaerolineales bacterium]|nr:phosphotransferase family protein [Anaerolineales bacterium]
MGLTLEQSIARVPFLKDAKDIKSSELTGGITNKNYKLETGGKAYMLRITGENTDLLGIKREIEHASNLAAGLLGIAPEVLYFIEPEGYLVTRFIDGKRIPPEEMVKPDNIRRVVRKLRMYHTRAPEVKGEFNVFRRVEHLIGISKQHGSKFPFDFDWIMGKMKDVETALLKDPYVPTPCHCDLLNLNFLDENVAGEIGEVKILDWEYAGMGDIFFDLGNFCHHHRFNDELVNVLLQEYFGEVTPKVFAHLRLMWPMSTIHESMWGTTQTGISKLEEDFQGYADLWFARTREAMIDPRWDQWLKDVAKK